MNVIRFATIIVIALGIGTTCLAADADTKAAVTGLTEGRARALIAVAIGLVSVAAGGLALSRSRTRGDRVARRRIATGALFLALTGIVMSFAHLGSSTGGFGTGGGRAGAIVSLLLGFIGMNLGGLALARARRDPLANPGPEGASE